MGKQQGDNLFQRNPKKKSSEETRNHGNLLHNQHCTEKIGGDLNRHRRAGKGGTGVAHYSNQEGEEHSEGRM